jgi:hypothetical protein
MRLAPILPALILVFAGLASPAAALPAPMPESELLSKSDLVALIRVLSVTCTGVSKDQQTGEDLPSYSATAELMYVTKGEEMMGHDITIAFQAIPFGLLGPWTVFYYPGEMVYTHLVRKDGSYTTTWWNGRGSVVSKALITELPTKPGDTVRVSRRNAQTRD